MVATDLIKVSDCTTKSEHVVSSGYSTDEFVLSVSKLIFMSRDNTDSIHCGCIFDCEGSLLDGKKSSF